jgi:hypothetical protein
MRDFHFALQGFERRPDGVITSGNKFDGVILQPYISFLHGNEYSLADQAKGFPGDASAVGNFIRYGAGLNPSNHRATDRFFIYSAWPRLEGIEAVGWDPAVGVATYEKFYDRPYTPPTNSGTHSSPANWVPSRDFVDQLIAVAQAEADAVGVSVHLIPVSEVFYVLDQRIRAGLIPGIAAHFNRNSAYYAMARTSEGDSGGVVSGDDLAAVGFVFIYPPFLPEAFQSDFIQEQGVKNFYADRVHMNNQTHNDGESGTLGAYVSAATVYAVLTGESPAFFDAATVAAIYEKFDPNLDAALIAALNEVIWEVVTLDPRTGVSAQAEGNFDYAAFVARHFSGEEIEVGIVTSPQADVAGDGVPNIVKFVHGLSPREPASQPLQVEAFHDPGQPSGRVGLGYRALANPRGVKTRFESSSDLDQWIPATPFAAHRSRPDGDGMVGHSFLLPATGPAQFFRSRYSLIPRGPAERIVSWFTTTAVEKGFRGFAAAGFSTTGQLQTDVPANPALNANYGFNIDSPVFFAAARRLSTTTTVSAHVMQNFNAPPDIIRFQSQNNTPAIDPTNKAVFAILWTAAGHNGSHGYLSAHGEGRVLGRMEAELATNGTTDAISSVHFLIRRNGVFYVSGRRGIVSGRININGFQSVALPNPATSEWFAVNPEDIADVATLPTAIPSFDGVDAVGLYLGHHGTANYAGYFLRSFKADIIHGAYR